MPTAPRARRFVVEAAVGVGLVVAALLALAAGGWFSVATADAGDAEAPSSAPPALVLQCPLGVHRVSLPSRQ